MATSTTTVNTQLANSRYKDTAATNSFVLARGSAETIYQIKIDNTANTTKAFLKLYDDADGAGLTHATTHPTLVLPVEASSSIEYGFYPGLAFAAGITSYVTTEAGTGANSTGTAVATAITIEILYS